MKNVLVPTDFSENANLAVNFAAEIASRNNATLILLNTYDVPHAGAALMVSVDDLLVEESNKGLVKSRELLKENFPNLEVQCKSHNGRLLTAVEKTVDLLHIDLVVMGTRGANNVEDKILGSNTSNLIQNISVPICTVPKNNPMTAPNRITVAVDLKFKFSDKIYNPLRNFAKTFGSQIRFLHVTTELDESKLNQMEKDFGTEVDFVYDKDVIEGINEYLDLTPTDMLAVVAEKHTFLEKIFKSSISKGLAKYVKKPLFIINEKK